MSPPSAAARASRPDRARLETSDRNLGPSGLRQHRDRRDRAGASQVVGEPHVGARHLHLARPPEQLVVDVVDHANARRADGMAARLEPARRVHGQRATEPRLPRLHRPPAGARLEEAKVLVVHDLGDGEAVVALRDLDLLGRIADARHVIGRLGGLPRGTERGEAPRRVELRVPVPRRYRVGDPADNRVLVGELGSELRAGEDGRGGAVGGGTAVEEPERLGDLGRLRVHLRGDFLLEVCLGVQRAVVVVLGRYRPQRCLARSVLLVVARVERPSFKEYGASEGALGAVATKNHYHGSLNPKAHFQKEITSEMHAKAPKVAEPLGLFDCCPTTDGAAAAILTRAELAPKFTDKYSIVRGIAYAVTAGYWNTQFDPSWSFTSFRATREAAKAAYHMAGIGNPAKEIKVAECHDCFTITEIVNYEDLGFFEPGTGWRAVKAGETRLGGSLPVNTSGGLKSCGHPIGSSGIRMINNVHDQLLGRAGKMQVAGANMGLAHNLGGPGSVSAVAVLSQP